MKMYILLKEDLPDKFAPLVAAHASLACYKKYEAEEAMQTWINGIFRKVICRVNEKEFKNAKNVEKNVLITESALDNNEVALVFCPRAEYPKMFRFFKMWRPTEN